MNTRTASSSYRSMVRYRVTCACLLVAACVMVPLRDASAEEPPTTTVSYGDLNLSQSKDVEILYKRLKAAAYRVCPTPDGRALDRMRAARPCIDKAIGDAVAKVDRPMLTAYHQSKTGGSPSTPTTLASR